MYSTNDHDDLHEDMSDSCALVSGANESDTYTHSATRRSETHLHTPDNVSLSNSPPFKTPATSSSSRPQQQDRAETIPHSLPSYQSNDRVTLCVYRNTSSLRATNPVGVSYYDPDTETIFVGEFGDMEICEHLQAMVHPGVIVTNIKATNPLFSELGSDQSADCSVSVAPAQSFQYDKALHRIQSMLQVEDVPRTLGPDDYINKNMEWRTILNMREKAMISSLGGLVVYMMKNGIINQLERDSAPMRVKSVRSIPALHTLFLDRLTARALSIFADERLFNDTRSKEGLSLFGILNRCHTSDGAGLLKRWLQFPSCDMTEINTRLEQVQWFKDRDPATLKEFEEALAGVKNVARLLARFSNSTAKVQDWKSILTSLQSFGILHTLALKHRDDDISCLNELQPLMTDNISNAIDAINSTLDLNSSKDGDSVLVHRGVSVELDRLIGILERLPQILTFMADRDMKSGVVPEKITSMVYVYFPQLGYFLEASKNIVSADDDIEGLKYWFEREGKLYFKSFRCNELEDTVCDIKNIVSDTQTGIVRGVLQCVLQASEDIIAFSKLVHRLDVLVSLGVVAREFNFCRPRLVEESVLIIKDGRHPLQELCTEQYIPNNTQMSATDGMQTILTGPNNSGKSVYLKQTGIITYLAHCGSFVPASSATVGITDRIMSRITNESTVTSSLSSFADDCQQVAFMFRNATPRSLLLLDEFGKGTQALDGASLLAAVIRRLDERQMCPRTVVVTHLHELITYALLDDCKSVCFYLMDVEQKRSEDGEETVFLYRIKKGKCTSSMAVGIGQRAGVDTTVLQRAVDVSREFANYKPVEPLECPELPLHSHVSEAQGRVFEAFMRTDFDHGDDSDTADFLRLLNEAGNLCE